MKFEQIQKLSFKDKSQILQIIAKEYQKAMLYIQTLDEKTKNIICDSSPLERENSIRREQINLVTIVNCVMNLLNKEHKEIIENDYFKNSDSKWWLEKYSKSTFYSLKNAALDNFTYYILI